MNIWTAALFGLVIGSFLNVLIHRLHFDEKGIFTGRSKCPKCKHVLRPLELIPLLSYLILRGKCKNCNKRISFWYPTTEATTAITFASLWLTNPNINAWIIQAIIFSIFLFIFFYDLRFKEIHDAVMIPAIIFALIVGVSFGDTQSSLIGGLIGLLFFGIQYYGSRGKWIGSGDILIGLFMGLVLGWKLMLVALVISYIFGSVVSLTLLATKQATRKTAIPLGPFLVIGSMTAFFLGDLILEWYLTI